MSDMDTHAQAMMKEIGLTERDFEAMNSAWLKVAADPRFASLAPQNIELIKAGFYSGYAAGRAH